MLSMETQWQVVRRCQGTKAFIFPADHFVVYLAMGSMHLENKWHFANGSKVMVGWEMSELKQKWGLGEVSE